MDGETGAMDGASGATAVGTTVGVNGGIGKSLNPLKRFFADQCAGEIAGASFLCFKGVGAKPGIVP
jgi:hypothetical protein